MSSGLLLCATSVKSYKPLDTLVVVKNTRPSQSGNSDIGKACSLELGDRTGFSFAARTRKKGTRVGTAEIYVAEIGLFLNGYLRRYAVILPHILLSIDNSILLMSLLLGDVSGSAGSPLILTYSPNKTGIFCCKPF